MNNHDNNSYYYHYHYYYQFYLFLLLLLLLLLLLFNTSTPQFFSPFSCLLASFLVEYVKSGPNSKKKVQPYSFHFEYQKSIFIIRVLY